MSTAEIEANSLHLAIEYNDMDGVMQTEARLITLRNQLKVQFQLNPCPHAKEQAGQSLLSINTDLLICRNYRRDVNHILLTERNSIQVELAENRGQDIARWVTEFGERFSELWSQGVRDINQFTLHLYGASGR